MEAGGANGPPHRNPIITTIVSMFLWTWRRNIQLQEQFMSRALAVPSTLNPLTLVPVMFLQENHPYNLGYAEETVLQYSMDDFRSHFRMSRSSFEAIYSYLESAGGLRDEDEEGQAIGAFKALLIFIWVLATPDSYRSIGQQFGVTKSTVFVCLRRIRELVIGTLLKKFISWPDENKRRSISEEFKKKWQITGVVGAIDGTHIPIQAPVQYAENYINRKKFHSIVLQAVCDNNLFLLDCNVGWPGSVHDARVLKQSGLWRHGHELCQPNLFIIGDQAYSLMPWLMTAHRDNGHLSASQKLFNKTLSKARSSIERAFALLKGRFRRLKFLDIRSMKGLVDTVFAACILHNICLCHEDDIEDLLEGEDEVGNDGNGDDVLTVPHGDRNMAVLVRNNLTQALWSAR